MSANKCLVGIAVLMLTLGGLPQNVGADVLYDLAADWSDTTNPNGVWSYNKSSGVPFTNHVSDWDASHLNWFQATHNVTLPILSPSIFFLAVVSLIKAFQSFNGFYALTGNGRGPLDTTQNMTVYIYATFYEYGRWGYGAAVASLLCLGIISLTLLQWRLIGRRVHYE